MVYGCRMHHAVLGNNTGTPITVSPTSTTTYYVRAEGAGNNTATAGVMVTVNTPSTAANGAVATPSTHVEFLSPAQRFGRHVGHRR